MIPKKEVRVRIAPSPTGHFHIGTARTALFNWLFAKKNGGCFILRIEDTDLERSDSRYETDILESLKWLGLDWDEGPYRQSERLAVYEKYINILLKQGSVYYCFCTKEELAAERISQLTNGHAPRYSGRCRSLDQKTVKEKLKRGEPSVLRLKVPTVKVSFKDTIRGKVSFDAGLIGDIVVAKNTRAPLYDLAVVIDDEEMKISHVIRGEDHLPNTPKQLIIQEALGFSRPKYAHLPLILDPDRSKMSKRFSATAIAQYRKDGYLPEAVVNFLFLLGWHPADDQEIFSEKEMIKKFELERAQKSGAIFNVEKLDWLNSQYIRKLTNKELAGKLDLKPNSKNLKIIALLKERLTKLSDFQSQAGFFYELPDFPSDWLPWKDNTKEEAKTFLQMIYDLGSKIGEAPVRILADKWGRGEVLWPLRVALSGQKASPGPFEIMAVLGKRETLRRIRLAIGKLQ